jgi:adenylate cyclase
MKADVRATAAMLPRFKKPLALFVRKPFGLNSLYLVFVVALLLVATIVRVIDPFSVRALRLLGFDWYQRLHPLSYDPQLPVRIVDIDEASLSRIGQWPWPRTMMRDLVVNLAGKGAAVIGFDILFAEADRSSIEEIVKRLTPAQAAALLQQTAGDPSNDQVFAAALQETPVVLAAHLTDRATPPLPPKAGFAIGGDDPRGFMPSFAGANGNLPILDAAAQGIGAINWTPDRDQIVRRAQLQYRVGDQLVPSLAAEMLRVAQGASTYLLKAANASGETAFGRNTGLNHVKIGDIEIPTDADGGIVLKFRPHSAAAFIPAWKVLSGDVPTEEVAGRIIVVGTSAPGLLDLRATPLEAAVPGVEIHAQLLEHILAGRSLVRPDYALALEESIVIALGLLLAVALPHVSARWAAALGLFVIAAVFLGCWLAFRSWGLLLDPVYPALALGCTTGAITFYVYRHVETQRSAIRTAFGHYLAPALVEQLAHSPEKLVLGGEERATSILFSDVRGFTSISELYKADPQGLTTLINRLLTPLTNAIIEHQGTIDKYIGDAIMAFWNAPLEDPNHEVNACASALEMMDRLEQLNRERQEEAQLAGQRFIPFRIGIGINTGRCVVGNLGSDLRFNYSVLGDPVNVASRLEGQTKYYGVPVIIGSRTAEKVKEKFATLEIDLITVKGKTEPEPIHVLLGGENIVGSVPFQELQKVYSAMLYSYRSRDWEGALVALQVCQSFHQNFDLGALLDLYRARIQAFSEVAPPPDWNGVFVAEMK